MSKEESCVVRIVNLEETCTKETLEELILIICLPSGDIKNIYLKKDDVNNIFYGYVVFEHSYDAAKMVQNLNGYTYGTNKFEVELIGPNLHYREFPESKAYEPDYYCDRCRVNHQSLHCPFPNVNFNRRIPREHLFSRLLSGVGKKTPLVSSKLKAKETKETPANTKVNEGASKSWRDGSSYANIYISNIHYTTTDSDLADLVKPFGLIKRLALGKDKETGRCRGFAHVNFKFRSDASEAISQLNDMSFKGRPLKAEWSKF